MEFFGGGGGGGRGGWARMVGQISGIVAYGICFGL